MAAPSSWHRARLTSFMQGQLRALWVDEPQTGDIDSSDGEPPVPSQRRSVTVTGSPSTPKAG